MKKVLKTRILVFFLDAFPRDKVKGDRKIELLNIAGQQRDM